MQALVAPPPSLPDPSFLDNFLEPFPQVLQHKFVQLMKYHEIQTSKTITQNAAAQSAWCGLVPKLSASHEFVSQGIIAVSALHQSRYMSSEKEQKYLQGIAAEQMNTGLISYRACMTNVSSENAVALFAFSLTTTVFVLITTIESCNPMLQSVSGQSLSTHRRNDIIQKLVEETTKLLICWRGAMVILVPHWYTLVKGPLAPILDREWWPHPIPSSPEAIEEDKKLHDLEKLWMRPDRGYEYWFDTLVHALKRLRDDFALISLLTVRDSSSDGLNGSRLLDWGAACSWMTQLPPSFTHLIKQKQPEAWILLAHYAILPSRMGDIWWTHGFGPYLVSTTALVIGPDMYHWIEWPAAVVGVDLRRLAPAGL